MDFKNSAEQIFDKIEDTINDKIDIPGVGEQEEGYLIHLMIALAATVVYIIIQNL